MTFGEGPCPHCGQFHDRATGLTGKDRPAVGDAMLCSACGGWGVFDFDGYRSPTPEEQSDLDADDMAQRARNALLSVILTDKLRQGRHG